MATGWTNYFVSRILLGEVLLNALKPTVLANGPGAAVLRNTCVAARWDMHQEAREICATVPFFLGLGPRTKKEMLGVGGGVMILLPLWIAACVEAVGHPLRQNATFLFDLIANRIGIGHASVQMRELAHVKGMAEWLDSLTLVAPDGDPGEQVRVAVEGLGSG